MAAEGDLVEGSDHDNVLRCIFVLDGYRYFASTVRRAHSLDEPGSSSRVIVGTREDIQEPGKSLNGSSRRGCLWNPNHDLVDLRTKWRRDARNKGLDVAETVANRTD